MALNIETFSNAKGGNAFFKAIGHPLAARRAKSLLQELSGAPVVVYDPLGYASAFAEIYDLGRLDVARLDLGCFIRGSGYIDHGLPPRSGGQALWLFGWRFILVGLRDLLRLGLGLLQHRRLVQ